ncbi:hypothetical protein AWB81_05391 [Caballeronia arationis]|nr:hypothetical protein AWB81_05391 [Caballeronia arationis]
MRASRKPSIDVTCCATASASASDGERTISPAFGRSRSIAARRRASCVTSCGKGSGGAGRRLTQSKSASQPHNAAASGVGIASVRSASAADSLPVAEIVAIVSRPARAAAPKANPATLAPTHSNTAAAKPSKGREPPSGVWASARARATIASVSAARISATVNSSKRSSAKASATRSSRRSRSLPTTCSASIHAGSMRA